MNPSRELGLMTICAELIRYHLFHPLNPRPLHLSRVRYLRHWTIHRAWHLFRAKQRRAEERSLEKQYQSMYNACEALRLLGEDGLAVQDVPVHGLPGIVSAEPGRIVRPPGARDPLSRRFVRRPDGTLYAEDLRSKDDAEKETQGKQADTENRREIVEVDVAAAAQRQQEVGRLYRLAMEKKGIFQGVPIEYARIQTDTPPRAGWDHGWKRPAPALI